MLKYTIVAVLLMSFATPALAAEFYLGQDPATKECKIMNHKPDGETMVMIGSETYASRENAKAAKKASPECNPKGN